MIGNLVSIYTNGYSTEDMTKREKKTQLWISTIKSDKANSIISVTSRAKRRYLKVVL